MTSLVLVGGGRMGEVLLSGLLGAGWAPADLTVVEVVVARRTALMQQFPGITVLERPDEGNRRVAADAILAVKPADALAGCAALGESGVARVLSIAAGVTLGTLEAALPSDTAVVRAMPNTPALIGAGMAAIAAGSAATEADMAWAERILGAVGEVVRTDEGLLDAVTGLSGSGPAYIFLVAEALIEAGVLAGLPRDVSTRLAVGTLLGSARMLAESGDGPEALRAAVTSPGGTTAAGLRALERNGVRSAFLEAVMAARDRSCELGQA